ncbi:MAG: hypothetical protein HYZ50_01905 [Deltaproteobacteria bacterium]|nr:hypothetical protein [Deltaproteobacteria bacterium]
MNDYSVTLPVPTDIYDRASHLAKATAQSIEAVLLQQLRDAFADPLPELPPEEQRELHALTLLSDEALWTIARAQMAGEKQARLQTLMEINNQGALDPLQRAELEALVEQGQQLSVRKAKAAALLTDRGYLITVNALSSSDE